MLASRAVDLDAIKAAHPLRSIIPRYAAGERHEGRETFWRCPFHEEKTGSLKITPDGGAFVCYGCGKKGDVIRFIMLAENMTFAQAVAFLSDGQDLPPAPKHPRTSKFENPDPNSVLPDEDALAAWRESRPAEGTPVELYLRNRAITIPIPPTLRYHPAVIHTADGRHYPAMIAAVQRPDRTVVAIHRTYLTLDGRQADKARLGRVKKMKGPCRGNAVRLGPASEHLIVAEGIETALSMMQASCTTAWAAMSAGFFQTMHLPPGVSRVTIAADGDPTGIRDAEHAAFRWTREGRRVRIAPAPDGYDWNDVLAGKAAAILEPANG